jgi:hypothetical protein
MIRVAIAFLAAALVPLQSRPPASGAFTRFLYCHDYSRGAYESQCVELNPDGIGVVRFKLRDETRATEEYEGKLALSAPALGRFSSALAATRHLADGARYESSKKNIGDLGKKRLAVDLPTGRREAVFNYSEIKEVRALAEFLDNLIEEEATLFALDAAQKYQRLAIPEKLDRIADLVATGRIVDPERVASALDRLQADARVLDSARDLARQIRTKLLKTK